MEAMRAWVELGSRHRTVCRQQSRHQRTQLRQICESCFPQLVVHLNSHTPRSLRAVYINAHGTWAWRAAKVQPDRCCGRLRPGSIAHHRVFTFLVGQGRPRPCHRHSSECRVNGTSDVGQMVGRPAVRRPCSQRLRLRNDLVAELGGQAFGE